MYKRQPYYFFLKQVIFIIIGTFFLFIFTFVIDYWDIKSTGKILMLISIIFLVLVYIPGIGKEINNAKRWIRIWKFQIQPAEFVKLFWVIYLCDFLDRNRSRIKRFEVIFGPFLLLIILSSLIYFQPDFGGVVVLNLIFFLMLFIAGYPLKYILLLLVFPLIFSYFAIAKVEYRMMRLLAFLSPFERPEKGWQIIQSLIALGSGGIFGKGMGASTAKLLYIPYAYTDFIFPIFGEEYGFIGCLVLISLYIFFFIECIKVSFNSTNYFAKLLAMGVSLNIILHTVLNIGIASGILPTKGLTLPFLSSGGSSLISNMIGVGIILNISIYGKKRINYF